MKITDEMRTFRTAFKTYRIPDHMVDGLESYFNHGTLQGGFLDAILRNDFITAMSRADSENIDNIQAYGYFLYNHAPVGSYGSHENVDRWRKRKLGEI